MAAKEREQELEIRAPVATCRMMNVREDMKRKHPLPGLISSRHS